MGKAGPRSDFGSELAEELEFMPGAEVVLEDIMSMCGMCFFFC